MTVRTHRPVRGIVRQGDVLLVPLEELPQALLRVPRRSGRVVLAEGEATGHAHVIGERTATLYRPVPYTTQAGPARFLLVEGGPATVRHEEHDAIVLAPGAYRVVRQREYAPAARGRRLDWGWVRD